MRSAIPGGVSGPGQATIRKRARKRLGQLHEAVGELVLHEPVRPEEVLAGAVRARPRLGEARDHDGIAAREGADGKLPLLLGLEGEPGGKRRLAL